jgi:hypothetical protein
MIKYREEERIEKVKIAESITCDDCGKTYGLGTDNNDIFETQEFHHIHFTGGYGSVFGDGDMIECDLCQHCLMKMIKGKYRIRED